MTEAQRDELLISMNSKLDKHDELLNSMNSKLDNHDEHLSKHDEYLSNHDEILHSIINRLNNHDSEFKEIRNELHNISRSIAVIEVEHGSKIQLLLDGQTQIFEILDSFKKKFENHDELLENYSNRIWNLESEVGIL